MSAVPELKDEINRKALESIQYLITSVHAGRITPHQFSTGIDALWMAVAGLINEDIIDLITAAGDEAPKDQEIKKRVFIKARETIVVDRVVGDDKLYVRSYFDADLTNTKCQPCTDAAHARDNVVRLAEKLLTAGYTEI